MQAYSGKLYICLYFNISCMVTDFELIHTYLGYMLHPHLIRGGQTGIRIVRYVT